MPTIIRENAFSGGSGLTDGTLSDAVRALAQSQAKARAETASDLTDNSAGAAADGTIAAIPVCSTAPATGDTCPTKTEVEAALVTVKNALTEIAAQIVVVAAIVPAFTPTNSVGGTTADGTIAAVTKTFTGDTSDRVAMAGLNTQIVAYRALICQLARDVNALLTATGQTNLVISALEATMEADGVSYGHTYAALTTTTGTAATNGLTSVTDAEAEASFAAMAAAVKELATKLNVITASGSVAVSVIAA